MEKKILLVMSLLSISLFAGCNNKSKDGVNPPFELDNPKEKITAEEAIKFAKENFLSSEGKSSFEVTPKSTKCEWDFTTTNKDHLEDVQSTIAELLLMKEPDYSQIGFKGVLSCTNCDLISPTSYKAIEYVAKRGASFYLHNNTNLVYYLQQTENDDASKFILSKEGCVIYGYKIKYNSNISGTAKTLVNY